MPGLPILAVTSGEPAGVGPELCAHLATRDWPVRTVVLGDIDEPGAEKVAQRIRDGGGKAVAQICNVASKADVDALVDRGVSEFGRVDVMSNIAGGLGPKAPVDEPAPG